jgi:L-iditol 2-dehydrogenase
LGPRGRLVVFSGLSRDTALQPVDLNRLHYLEQTLVGAYGCSRRHGEQALDWIDSNRVAVTDLITHRLPLHELGLGLDLVRTRKAMKVLLYPNP